MTYEVILPTDTKGEILDYLIERFDGVEAQEVAFRLIEQELVRLGSNPLLGAQHHGGPFESRRTYRFSFIVNKTRYRVEVAYKILDTDRLVVVAGFRPLVL